VHVVYVYVYDVVHTGDSGNHFAYSVFSVSIELTVSGLEHVDEVGVCRVLCVSCMHV
jgi:hypothetical protein